MTVTNPPDDVAALLDLLEARRDLLTSRPNMSRQLAAGGLARAEALMRCLRLIMVGGRPDVAGLFMRAIWECWCVGLYVILVGDDAAEHLLAYHRNRSELYVDRWPEGIEPSASMISEFWQDAPDADGRWNLEQITKMVEERLREADQGPVAYSGVSSYDVFYRLVSQYDAHAGYAVFARYLQLSEDGSREETIAAPAVPMIELRGESLAAVYTAHLAWHVYRAFGISTVEVESLLLRFVVEADMLAEADPAVHG